MGQDRTTAKRKLYFDGRWSFVLALIGILMVAFVVATRGEHATWLLWIAIPLLMFSLGYLYIVNAVATVWGVGTRRQDVAEQEAEDHEK